MNCYARSFNAYNQNIIIKHQFTESNKIRIKTSKPTANLQVVATSTTKLLNLVDDQWIVH